MKKKYKGNIFSIRRNVKEIIFEMGGLKHIHIIGCARTGTTMLHYAMALFDGIVLIDRETSVTVDPSIIKTTNYFIKSLVSNKSLTILTKRLYGWYSDPNIAALISTAIRRKIGIIELIRDPRDVLTSKHKNPANDSDEYYVSPERWAASIEAGEKVQRALENIVPYLKIRYEDLVCEPKQIENTISSIFNLNKISMLEPINKMATNLARLNIIPKMEDAMHTLRDFDSRSINRWKNDKNACLYIENLLADAKYGQLIQKYCKLHSYELV